MSERGVVVGAGFALHSPISSHGALDSWATTPMTYVGILPLRWLWAGRVTRKYCASYDGQTQANFYAAQETFPDASKRRLATKIAEEKAASGNGPIRKATNWNVMNPGKCFGTSPGLFVALPTSFDANIDHAGSQKSLTVNPLLSFGIFDAPTSWLNILVGVTVSHVAIEDENRQVWSLLFAIGTPIDAIGGAFSK